MPGGLAQLVHCTPTSVTSTAYGRRTRRVVRRGGSFEIGKPWNGPPVAGRRYGDDDAAPRARRRHPGAGRRGARLRGGPRGARRAHGLAARDGARGHVRHLLPHRRLVTPQPAATRLAGAAVRTDRALPGHPGPPRHHRADLGAAVARQALLRLTAADQPTGRSVAPASHGAHRPAAARRRIGLPARHRRGEHRSLVPVGLLLPGRALLGGVDGVRGAADPRGAQAAGAADGCSRSGHRPSRGPPPSPGS